MGVLVPDQIPEMAEKMALSRRFSDWKLDCYRACLDTEQEIQFAALTIDLGSVKTIRGFAYTPQNHNAEGMIERGTVWVSQDKQNWKKVEDFMFGNLINDPTKRSCTFKNATEARYFKIQMTEGTNRSEKAAVAEVDIF